MPQNRPETSAATLLAQIRLRPWGTTYVQLEVAAVALGFREVVLLGSTKRWFVKPPLQFPLPKEPQAALAPVGVVREILSLLEEAV